MYLSTLYNTCCVLLLAACYVFESLNQYDMDCCCAAGCHWQRQCATTLHSPLRPLQTSHERHMPGRLPPPRSYHITRLPVIRTHAAHTTALAALTILTASTRLPPPAPHCHQKPPTILTPLLTLRTYRIRCGTLAAVTTHQNHHANLRPATLPQSTDRTNTGCCMLTTLLRILNSHIKHKWPQLATGTPRGEHSI